MYVRRSKNVLLLVILSVFVHGEIFQYIEEKHVLKDTLRKTGVGDITDSGNHGVSIIS